MVTAKSIEFPLEQYILIEDGNLSGTLITNLISYNNVHFNPKHLADRMILNLKYAYKNIEAKIGGKELSKRHSNIENQITTYYYKEKCIDVDRVIRFKQKNVLEYYTFIELLERYTLSNNSRTLLLDLDKRKLKHYEFEE